MTLLGIVGILLGLAAWPFAFLHRSRSRVAVFALAYVAHVLSAVVYYIYVQTAPADTAMYYGDSFGMYEEGFGLSTQFIIYFVQSIKLVFGGSYLDYFFLFQSFGFFGIVLLMRTFEEIYAGLTLPQPRWTYLLLLLPGMYFWTSGIGKDAPLFTACCLATWATMQVRRRYIALAAAIVLMLLIRPHIALIAAPAAMWAVFSDRTTHPLLRTVLILASISGVAAAAATIKSTFQLDVTSADSVSDFLEARDSFMTSDEVGNTAVINAPYPVRVFSFLFRPLFVDAEGAFGYIASAENVLLLVLFMLMTLNARTLWAATKAEPFLRYAVISSLGITLALSIDYYNVGLGLRQKTMVVPGFLTVFIALSAVRMARRRTHQFLQVVRARPRMA
jgi:hypothetical protein